MRSLAPLLAAVALLQACAPPQAQPDTAQAPAETASTDTSDAPRPEPLRIGEALGSPDAPLIVTEFSDPGCWSCSSFVRESFPTLRREFIDTGLVQWRTAFIDRGFSNGVPAARAARCAARQDRLWDLRLVMAQRQRDWITRRNVAVLFTDYAAEIGLEMQPFTECMAAAAAAGMSLEEMAALQLGVRAVPTFLVGSQRVLGALSTADFRAIITRELNSRGR
jgi:protein-disulfide isomerase